MFRSPAFSAAAFVPFLLIATGLPAQAPQPQGPADSASAQTAGGTAASPGASKIRIVRLSEVKGSVTLDRNIGRGFEPAIANMPIVENSRLRTGEGIAEVEFEDNSTLRLGQSTEVAFPQLERLASGKTASSVQVIKGTAYASLTKTQGSEFNLVVGSETLALPPGSHVRLDSDQAEAKLAVLDGSVQVNGASGPVTVQKKKTVTFALTGPSEPTVAKNVESEPLDSWDKDAAAYHARTASYSALNGTPYTYGMNDLMYYGSFMDAGGCGTMWRPYFASTGWDPYANGVWAFYQGAGYTWVSPYPWGWMPYHYGSWSFCPGTGWGWMPGGAWTGLGASTALIASNPSVNSPIRIPAAPVHPPRVGEPSLLAISSKPLVRSEAATTDSFVFRKDSAGYGIPRSGLGKLDGFSRQSVNRGSVSTPIYMSGPPQQGSLNGRPGAPGAVNGRPQPGGVAPPAMHRGYSPAPANGGADTRGNMSGGSGAGPRGGPGPDMGGSGRSGGMSPGNSGAMHPSSSPSPAPAGSSGGRSH